MYLFGFRQSPIKSGLARLYCISKCHKSVVFRSILIPSKQYANLVRPNTTQQNALSTNKYLNKQILKY